MSVEQIQDQASLEQAFAIRIAVFVEEQGVPLEEELDSFDRLESGCAHVLVYYNGKPVGTGRVRKIDAGAKLERICLLEEYRKHGLGKEIIGKLEAIAQSWEVQHVMLHGQTHAESFYQKLGYTTASDVFDEDGIDHVKMKKELKKGGF